MDFSGIIDVAIGMAFVFLLFSLICSALVEMFESWSRKRGRLLWQGLKDVFCGHEESVRRLYQQPFVYALFEGNDFSANSKKLPSYIPERSFALALLSLVLDGKKNTPGDTVGDFEHELKTANLPLQLRKQLTMMAQMAEGDKEKLLKSLEDIYISATERLSGRYKRHTQLVAFICALFIASVANVDSLVLVNSLMTDGQLRGTLVKSAESYLDSGLHNENGVPAPVMLNTEGKAENQTPVKNQTLAELADGACRSVDKANIDSQDVKDKVPATADNKDPATTDNKASGQSAECRYYVSLLQVEKLGLPIGWNATNPKTSLPPSSSPDFPNAVFNKIIGILLTAICVSLGAPFWFDVLNKFMNVRNAVKSVGGTVVGGAKEKQK